VEKQLFRDFVTGKSMDIAEFTKLTRNEFNRICFGDKKHPGDQAGIRMRIHYLTVLSPFLWHAQLSFDQDNFFANTSRAVKQSCEKIERFLGSVESANQNDVDLKSLLHLSSKQIIFAIKWNNNINDGTKLLLDSID